MNVKAREHATAHYRAAADAIDNVFDRAEQLAPARAAIVALAEGEPGDVVANVVDVLAAADRLRSELGELRAAAATAVEYSSQRQLAGDLGTRQSLLFPGAPRAGRRRETPDPAARSSAQQGTRERPPGDGAPEPGQASELSVDDG